MRTRADHIRKICDLLVSPANVAIHGTPSSGKSWLADQVVHRLSASAVKVYRIDASVADAGNRLFADVRSALSEPSETAAIEKVASTHQEWRKLRTALSASEEHVVVVLDQFDKILKYEDSVDFLHLLRELAHRPESTHCTLLLISRRSLPSIEISVRGISTLDSVCYSEPLGSISATDLDELGPGAQALSVRDKKECLAWSGGHPALAKYWLVTRPDLNPDPAADRERAKVARRVVDHLDDAGLLSPAAQHVLGPIVDVDHFKRMELELLGVLPVDEMQTEDGSSFASQEIFRSALRHKTWNMDPWGVLGKAEVELRSVIEVILSDAYGTDWVTIVGRKNKAVADSVAEASDKQGRDRKMFGRQAPWISYTYPNDLWRIIQLEWVHFEKVFSSHNKQHWRTVFEGLAQYRTPLAHNRAEVLSASARTQCRLHAEEILTSVERFKLAPEVPALSA